ncbi:MAG: hypothetical protein ABFS24_06680 [Pseudomonadota bacterium]
MMQQHMMSNMRNHLVAINEILISMTKGDFEKSAEVAEYRLGMSSLESHGASHMAKFMPEGMRQAGTAMHKAASRFALKAQEEEARAFTRIDQVKVKHKPRLLSNNGPCYITGELSDYLATNGMTHTRGRPYHPQTQGKIERWHRSMKNQILLENYYMPGELKIALQQF